MNNNQTLEEIAVQMAVDLDARRERRMGLFAVVGEMKRRPDEAERCKSEPTRLSAPSESI